MATYYIFETKEQAEAYILEVNNSLGLPAPGVPETPPNEDGSPGYGWTISWALPEEYENSWKVIKHPDVDSLLGTILVIEDPLI